MKRSINKKMMLRLAAQADEADLYGSHHIADNLTYVLKKYAEENNIRDNDTNYEYNKKELIEDVENMMWDAATRVFDYYDELPDGRDIEDFIETFTNEYMQGLDNIIHSKVGKHEEKTPGEETVDKGTPDEVVHWEIKFENNDDDDGGIDDEERSTFILKDFKEEEDKEEEDKEEKDKEED
ncbi:MAG TPA: hypothetical protein VMX17_11940 [Candidatus Glassbacteria bacterium]|nr:hypothetical protein [Candidatus Glassbacteria bacterium]